MNGTEYCKSCNKRMAPGAHRCHYCGTDHRNFFMKHIMMSGIFMMVFFISLIIISNRAGHLLINIIPDKYLFFLSNETSDVPKIYILTDGNYTAGIDLPIGKCNIVAISGNGNLYSTNMYNGGINQSLGVNDGTKSYTSTFVGLKMARRVTLTISGGLTVKISYTDISSGYSGRVFDKENIITLSDGNYVAGKDFPAGVYNVEAVSGEGKVQSDNKYIGGINEAIGVKDNIFKYISSFNNANLGNNINLYISDGVTIRLIPVHINVK